MAAKRDSLTDKAVLSLLYRSIVPEHLFHCTWHEQEIVAQVAQLIRTLHQRLPTIAEKIRRLMFGYLQKTYTPRERRAQQTIPLLLSIPISLLSKSWPGRRRRRSTQSSQQPLKYRARSTRAHRSARDRQ
jgi:hypothetical protein